MVKSWTMIGLCDIVVARPTSNMVVLHKYGPWVKVIRPYWLTNYLGGGLFIGYLNDVRRPLSNQIPCIQEVHRKNVY